MSTPQLDGECRTTITHLLKKSSVKLLFSIPHNQTCALIISVWKKRSRFWFGFRNRNLETGQDCDFDPFSHSETQTRERVTFTHVTVGNVLRRYQNSAATGLLHCFVDLECRANLFSTERYRERTIRIKQRRRRSHIFNI